MFPKIGDFVDVCDDEGLAGVNYDPNNAADMADALRQCLGNMYEANRLAAWNKVASMEMPMSEVVAFHIDRLRRELKEPGHLVPQSI